MAVPDKKISETFLAFAEPLFMEGADTAPTRHQVEQILKVAFTVWNAIVFDTVHGNDRYVSDLRKLMAKDPLSVAIVEGMITRKLTEFADDLRVIGDYELYEKNGEWRLRAEAKLAKRNR
jgi:hypothetical protein